MTRTSEKCLQYLVQEWGNGNVLGRDAFKHIYEAAVREPHSFLTIRLDQPDDMFFRIFSERLSYEP